MLHPIFSVDVPKLEGGYEKHFSKWDDVAAKVRVYTGGYYGNTEVFSGYTLDYEPSSELFVITDSSGSTVSFNQVPYFPYASKAPQEPEPKLDDMVLQVSHTNATFHGGTGSITATVTGSNSPFSFTLNGGSAKSGSEVSWSNLVPATYTVKVTDAAGYTRSQTVTITEPAVEVVYGCTDPSATNYDPTATDDNGLCEYNPESFICMTVEVRPCKPNGVYLRWFNNKGGIDSWLFTGQVERMNAAEAMGEFSEYSGLAGAAIKTAERAKLVRTTKLSLNEWENVCGIFSSKFVWHHHEDGTKERVYVKPTSATYAKNQKELEVEFSRVPFNSLTR